MSKKRAMSTLGYAIVLVIILGVVMIISAPMMIDKYKKGNNSQYDNYVQSSEDQSKYLPNNRVENQENTRENSDELFNQLRIMEDRINTRLEYLESRQNQNSGSSQSSSDKYVCEIEGNVDADGNVTPIDNMSMNEVRKRKIVFVCEYRY